ncbi:putative peroxisomal membrane protein pmp47a protein [Zalerion maritima]|uniref:Peroxisomal membrane protein pmp47a protein n=1 Tax=Zalerion maritima TaxID=339359 RepID=A0AAD5WYL6_9PEZI|nr:putative peroxisomal membrane protein pmp47a protein [Zalerion maritima]
MVAPSKPSLPPNDNVAHALAGAGGGILSMVLTYPLITLSTRAQVESSRSSASFLKAVNSIIAREGISGLYSGLDSALFGISVTNFVYYYWYEFTRAFYEKAKTGSHKKLSTWESMVAGAIAGSATVILTNPIWVINTRMTTRSRAVKEIAKDAVDGEEKKDGDLEAGATSIPGIAPEKPPQKAKGTISTLLALIKDEGPSALFSGVLPALVLVINPILQYTLFEQMKNAYERRKKTSATPSIAFVLGALGKLFATSVTYPYITVKSRMHVAGSGQKEGMTAALKRVVKEEGYAGLYKGIGPKVVQSVMTAALLFAFKDMLYEKSVRLRMAAARKALA